MASYFQHNSWTTMMSFILFFPILTKVGNVFAVPTTVGEVTIKVIEDIVEGEQELTNDIFQDFDKVDCLFFQKENSIGNCKSTEWGILLLLVINGLIYSILIRAAPLEQISYRFLPLRPLRFIISALYNCRNSSWVYL